MIRLNLRRPDTSSASCAPTWSAGSRPAASPAPAAAIAATTSWSPSRARAAACARPAPRGAWPRPPPTFVEHVFPEVPVRQWVVTFPRRLRYVLHRDPVLLGVVRRSVLRRIETGLRRHCPDAPCSDGSAAAPPPPSLCRRVRPAPATRPTSTPGSPSTSISAPPRTPASIKPCADDTRATSFSRRAFPAPSSPHRQPGNSGAEDRATALTSARHARPHARRSRPVTQRPQHRPVSACTRAWHHAPPKERLNPLSVIKSIERPTGVQARRLITSRLIEALLRRVVVWDRDRVTWDAIF